MRVNKHTGSNFDDFLKEEGLLEEAEAIAAKRIFVFQLEQELKKQKINQMQFARLLGTSRSSIRRLLDPCKPSTLRSLSQAAAALGKHLSMSLV